MASDGRFNPCCAPDALRRTLGDFGNVNNTSLYDIWESAAYGEPPVELHAEASVPGLQHAEAGRHVSGNWRDYRISADGHSPRLRRETRLRSAVLGRAEVPCAGPRSGAG